MAITGDLAHAGVGEEYTLARDWLENQLWPAVGGLPHDRLLLVPGNHDVDRSKVGTGIRSMQDGLLNGRMQDQIGAVLSDDDERRMMLKRHTAYLDFLASWLREAPPMPWWQRVIAIRGCHLHVAGLDSAWMACSDEDRGRLLLGRCQLTQTVETAQADGADWRVALLHHPWDYLAEFDCHSARALVHQHCDLLLRGHLHFPQSERILPPDLNRGCLELAAGCVYETSQYPNAFQWIELSPAGKRVRVHFRAWLHNEWTIDRNQPRCREGHAEFDLAAPSSSRRGVGLPPAAVIPPEYLEWLQRTCADVSLLGQDIQRGHAFTLSHVYVPALTRPEAPPVERNTGRQKQREEAEEQKPVPLLPRLDQESLYVPAPAGAGKSTFCRWAALQSIPGIDLSHPVPAPDIFAEAVPTKLRTRLPLLAVLREFWRRMDCGRGERTWHRADLERALATWVDASPPPGLSGDLLTAHLTAGSAFLLLDGLDEVPPSEICDNTTIYPRELLLTGLADALPAWQKAGNRILLTSRPYGLDESGLHRLGLPSAPLAPLSVPLQDLFVTRWFHTLGKQDVIPDLIATIRGRGDLAQLVENPMLLTALCVLYDSGGHLPEDRYDLYKSIVKAVLHNRYPGEAREREPVLRRLEAIAYGMHTGDTSAPRTIPAPEISWVETEQWLARFAEVNPAYEKGSIGPAIQREELLTRSGLLLPRSNERAAFYHLTFQDFLAAQRIARISDDFGSVFRARGPLAEWRSTLLFLFAAQVFNKDAEWGLELLDRLAAEQDRAAVKANPALAGFIADALELCLAKGYGVPDALADRFRRLALDAIEDEIEVRARQALGLCQGRLGDPRIRDLRDPAAYVEVPAGTYRYDDKRETVRIETPFLLGRYPVTNGQYKAFLDDGGYGNRDWWSDAGWAWLHKAGVTEPRWWHDRRWNGPNQPVGGVGFWEAEACCCWAGGRLPRETEWEAAARGPDGFTYPWGNDWQDGICNSDEAGLGVTSPVGLFPRSRQARLGLEDLAGNVWEWCDDDQYDSSSRVLRGGSFNFGSWGLRAMSWIWGEPGIWSRSYGFRCVLAPPRQHAASQRLAMRHAGPGRESAPEIHRRPVPVARGRPSGPALSLPSGRRR